MSVSFARLWEDLGVLLTQEPLSLIFFFHRCYTCRLTWYCSPECHDRHAPVHKRICTSDHQDPSLIWPNGKVFIRTPPSQVRILALG